MNPQRLHQSTSANIPPKLETHNDENSESYCSGLPEIKQFVPLDWIVPAQYQPRQYFDEDAMLQLTASVKEDGIIQPLLVRPIGEKYEIVTGERRYRAAIKAGLTSVPVTIQKLTDEQAVQCALVENLQREDLNPIEEVEGILQLLALKLKTDREAVISLLNQMANVKRGLTDNVVRNEERQIVEEMFATVGRFSPESFRTHRLPLLNLPDGIFEALRTGRIEYTKAKAIAKLKSESERMDLLEEAITQSLSFSQIREKIKAKKFPKERGLLQSRMETTYKKAKKSKVWENPAKCEKLESLLAEMEALLSEEE